MPHAAKRLSLAIRKRLPGPVRRVLRLVSHVFRDYAAPPWLPPALMADCRICASRDEMLTHFPRGGRVAEIGVETGAFSRRILDIVQPDELHLIDLDFSALDEGVRLDERVTVHEGASHERIARFADDYLDWIYIDADHSYAGVARDAAAASAKVKPGGLLVFNDFAHIDPLLGAYGVQRAVVEFAVARNWPFVWFAYHPAGLYDVALRRPD